MIPVRLDVYGYPNNIKGERPRRPLVHLLASDTFDVKSISFHPDDAPAVAKAILAAAKSARAGRQRKPIKIEFKSED